MQKLFYLLKIYKNLQQARQTKNKNSDEKTCFWFVKHWFRSSFVHKETAVETVREKTFAAPTSPI